MEASELEAMSLKELRAFRERIDSAIRAAIARKRIGVEAKSVTDTSHAIIDLTRERDAWKARKDAVELTFSLVAGNVRSDRE